jgi:hypothetical protein
MEVMDMGMMNMDIDMMSTQTMKERKQIILKNIMT